MVPSPASLPPLSRGGTLWTRCSPQLPFRYFLSHHWDEIKTSWRTHSSSYLYIGIALMLATCISCVAGLSERRSGHSSTSREVATPHSTNPKISRTMLCRGIATKLIQWIYSQLFKYTLIFWDRKILHIVFLIPSYSMERPIVSYKSVCWSFTGSFCEIHSPNFLD